MDSMKSAQNVKPASVEFKFQANPYVENLVEGIFETGCPPYFSLIQGV